VDSQFGIRKRTGFLVFGALGLAAAMLWGIASGSGARDSSPGVVAGRVVGVPSSGGVLRMSLETVIEGEVRGERGEPVQGARVVAHRGELTFPGDFPNGEAISGSSGEFEISGLGRGSYTVHAERVGAFPSDDVKVELESGQRQRVSLRFNRGPRLLGTVHDASDGKPLAKAAIEVTLPGQRSAARVETDNEGRFEIFVTGWATDPGSVPVFDPHVGHAVEQGVDGGYSAVPPLGLRPRQ
jgi:hypothetical protein